MADTNAGAKPRPPMAAEAPAQVELVTAAPQKCLNCETPGAGNFCAQCGQRRGELRPTFADLVSDFSKYFLRVDSKFLRTLRFLVTRPGFLTLEYLAGRRERYEKP